MAQIHKRFTDEQIKDFMGLLYPCGHRQNAPVPDCKD